MAVAPLVNRKFLFSKGTTGKNGRRTVMFAGVVAPDVDPSTFLFDEVVEVSALAPPGASHAEALRHAGVFWASRQPWQRTPS
jgi:hypothetical protein